MYIERKIFITICCTCTLDSPSSWPTAQLMMSWRTTAAESRARLARRPGRVGHQLMRDTARSVSRLTIGFSKLRVSQMCTCDQRC